MGAFAAVTQERLRDALAATRPGFEWTTEYALGGTPVDVAGESPGRLVLVELEWRRADPADNAAKLFRHLVEGTVGAERVVVCQVFTAYYDLEGGGVSSKRENAEFVGRAAADAVDGMSYHAVDLPLYPPKAGGDPPEGWEELVGGTARRIADLL